MSFLTRTALRTSRITIAPRAFSTSLSQRKVVPDSVKEAADKANKVAGQKIVDGIELGEQAAQKVKETAGMTSAEAKGKAKEAEGTMKGKAHEAAGAVKGKANEVQGKL